MASWKIMADPAERNIDYVSLTKSRKFFAVDDSASTKGRAIRHEREFIEYFRKTDHRNPQDSISLWGGSCDKPITCFDLVSWDSKHHGTYPANILRTPTALDAMKKSDVWFLLTDGQIHSDDVHELANLSHSSHVLGIPIVFLIVGRRGCTPGTTDISVGISFFASARDALVLFKEKGTGIIHVVAAKGRFTPLNGNAAAQELDNWADVPSFVSEEELFRKCEALGIQVAKAKDRDNANFPRGIDLGPEWERAHGGPVTVDLERLTQAGSLSDTDVSNLCVEGTFNTLAIAYKTRHQVAEFRSFLQSQKIEQVALKLEDVAGAAIIVEKLGQTDIGEEDRKRLQQQLRQAHFTNRETYQRSVAESVSSAKAKCLKNRNRLLDYALRTLSYVEAADFKAEILSRRSNRARRAEQVPADGSTTLESLDLEGPSCRGFCLVCCGEEEVMAICLKELDAEYADDNTTNFALDFPLAAGSSPKNTNLISSQNICFQCALASSGMSIYKEKLKAIMPVVQYEGSNKKYINDQLYLALTAGLATGDSGIAQLFMSMLEEVLKTKPWAGAGLNESRLSTEEACEATQRLVTFDWMLNQLIEHTQLRRNFRPTGGWVSFPEALAWVAKEFEAEGLASFAVTYPAAGFDKLVSLGSRTAAFSEDVLRRLRIAKAIYSIAAKYLADMQANIWNAAMRDEWKQSYLETIYQDFNATSVPKDLGPNSIVSDVGTFSSRLSACLGKRHARAIALATPEDQQLVMGKIQIILFWLIFQQKSHCTAQTFFWDIRHREQLAEAVLDPRLRVPEAEARIILISIFAGHNAQMISPHASTTHSTLVPFRNPFGASVLRCGVEACNQSFGKVGTTEITRQIADMFRRARREHLVDMYGIRDRFESSSTGLPEKFAIGRPPSSIHANLHIGLVRAWTQQSQGQRRAIINNDQARGEFVAIVRRAICEQRRGDVFRGTLDDRIKALLPSFWEVLGQALKMQGRSGEDVTLYEHDFQESSVAVKMRWELEAGGYRSLLDARELDATGKAL